MDVPGLCDFTEALSGMRENAGKFISYKPPIKEDLTTCLIHLFFKQNNHSFPRPYLTPYLHFIKVKASMMS